MSYKLRPYQQEAVDAVWEHLRTRDDNPCVVLPTGCGKSLVLAEIAKQAVQNWGGRVLVLAHVKELLEQNAGKVKSLCPEIDIGVYSAGLKSRDTKGDVIVAGIQSVYNKACDLDRFDIIIIDEAHLIPPDGEGMYRKFLEDSKIINPQVRLIGMTATPYRLRGGLICKPENLLNHVCYEAGLKEMIVQGYLTPIITKAGSAQAKLDDLHIRGGEFVADEVEAAMMDGSVTSQACREIVEMTKDRNAVLIFGCSVAHCKKIMDDIQWISKQECAMVTGETSAAERAEILDRIKGKEVPTDLFGGTKPPLKYLVNVNVLTTGFDAPNIDCVAIMRPTMSAGLLVQMVGRGLRLSPETAKKNCLLLDYGENIMRHGPLDAIRVQEPRKGQTKDGAAPVRKCPQCNSLIEASRQICPDCGYVFPEREIKHDGAASTEAPLTGQITDTEYEVLDMEYELWRKRGQPDAPPTCRVNYQISFHEWISEWLCPQHTGYARGKFEKWWKEHTESQERPAPDTAQECVDLGNGGAIKQPTRITVRHISGEKFDRIVAYAYDGERRYTLRQEPPPFEMQMTDEQAAEWYGCNTPLPPPLPTGYAYTPPDDGIPF